MTFEEHQPSEKSMHFAATKSKGRISVFMIFQESHLKILLEVHIYSFRHYSLKFLDIGKVKVSACSESNAVFHNLPKF